MSICLLYHILKPYLLATLLFYKSFLFLFLNNKCLIFSSKHYTQLFPLKNINKGQKNLFYQMKEDALHIGMHK